MNAAESTKVASASAVSNAICSASIENCPQLCIVLLQTQQRQWYTDAASDELKCSIRAL